LVETVVLTVRGRGKLQFAARALRDRVRFRDKSFHVYAAGQIDGFSAHTISCPVRVWDAPIGVRGAGRRLC
jgi:hypothetical protein